VTVTYSTIKTLSERENIAALLAEQVIMPILPSVRVKGVRTKFGKRYEAPRILWNVYEAQLELPGDVEGALLFWTKAFFDDNECQEYRKRIAPMLDNAANPLDPSGYARFFPELNLFLFVFPADPVFPKLPTGFDAKAMMPLLEEHFRRLKPNGTLGPLTAHRVKYLPEISCIVRYEAEVAEERPLAIYGKFQHSKRGAQTYEVMRALWDLPARVQGDLVLSEPLAYYPRYSLLLQSEVRGEEIKSDRHSEVFIAQCEAAGRAIGHIHESGIGVGEPHGVEVELNRLYGRMDLFRMSAPKVYLMIRDLLKQISARADRIPPEPPVPSHGDYKYNQFLYDGTHFAMIDVEYFVQAEPSFDLGKYCGHLVPSTPEHWSDTVQANNGRRLFLDAYSEVRPEYQGGRFPIYEALSLATRALVATWGQPRNWEYIAETMVALAYERLKTPWGE
jgi:aminoglycoside phosphotransferase (APT) family kinase protein